MKQREIINEIRSMCNDVGPLLSGSDSCHFMYNGRHYIYMSGRDETLLRFCIPRLIEVVGHDRDRIVDAVNVTNRNVKFIKAVVLECGSIALNYDYKMNNEELVAGVVSHIIRSLDFAAEYLLNELVS